MITTITSAFIITSVILYLFGRLHPATPEKDEPRQQTWAESLIERDKFRESWENEMYANSYRRRIQQDAEEDYDWWLNRKPFEILRPMKMGSIITVGTNHREIFPKRLEEYVKEEFEKIRSERHTPEEIIQIEYDQKKAFWNSMGMEIPDEDKI